MATSAYHHWVNDGRPWRVARPVEALVKTLRAHGYVCFTIGNEEHLQSSQPEDHAPIGTTGWPGKHPYGWVLACDVMPPKKGQRSKVDGKPLPSLQALGKRIYADKQAGVRGLAWLKYANWEPDRNWDGRCFHDSWQPNHARRNSTDRGHIHLSCRTDFHTSAVGDGYDPVARIRGTAPKPAGDDMTPEDLLNASIPNPVTGKPATFRAFVQSINSNAYAANKAAAAVGAKLAGMQAAIVAAIGQVDEAVGAQLADEFKRINTAAAAQAAADQARDTAEQQRDADLLALVRQGQDGTLDAADVVARIGALLTAAAPDDA